MTQNLLAAEQPFISRMRLATRWDCCTRTVCRRTKAFGIKPIKLGHKSVFYKMEDILRVEAQC
jgi:hypothetical protein